MRRPVTCPKCLCAFATVKGPILTFACGATYRTDGRAFVPDDPCAAKPPAEAPAPESDPVHGVLPTRFMRWAGATLHPLVWA